MKLLYLAFIEIFRFPYTQFSINLGNFQPSFLQISFLPTLFFPFFSPSESSHNVYVSLLHGVQKSLRRCSLFLLLIFFFFFLLRLKWSIFKFGNYFLLFVESAV